MSAIDWSQLNDYLFVKMVGDLLGRLGFVDVEYQGAGPDGGIDLFATELLPFAIQGRIPFRWAIQCKFSSNGTHSSLSDNELRDVEAILRSERYRAQEPRGYMVITNRRITQNVLERLRGIDRNSQFRTARVDGARLESLLTENSEIVDRYFGNLDAKLGLGKPDLIIFPRIVGSAERLTVLVHLSCPFEPNSKTVQASGIIDTGSTMTVVPPDIVSQLGLRTVDYAHVMMPVGSRPRRAQVVDLVIRIDHVSLHVQAVVFPVAEVIIGLDVLKNFTVVFDPTGAIRLYKRPGPMGPNSALQTDR